MQRAELRAPFRPGGFSGYRLGTRFQAAYRCALDLLLAKAGERHRAELLCPLAPA
jgi:hypothetical protein